MSFWIPKPTGRAAPEEAQLSDKEQLVLSRIDGTTSVTHLNFLPGLSAPVVERILDRFVEMGLVEPNPGPAEAEADDETRSRRRTSKGFAPLMPQPPPMRFVESAPEPTVTPEPSRASPFSEESVVEQFVLPEPDAPAGAAEAVEEEAAEAAEAEAEAAEAEAAEAEAAEAEAAEAEAAEEEPGFEEDVKTEEDAQDRDPTEVASEAAGPDEADLEQDDPDGGERDAPGDRAGPLTDVQLNNYRRMFETQLKHLERDSRVELARTTTEELLYALCFDEFPGVIAGILENPSSGLQHARMIAQYHGKSMGIEHLVQRAQYLGDRIVQRYLLRNRVTPEPVLKRLLRLKPLKELFKLNFSREMSERAKRVARDVFRGKFQTGSAEECIALVFGTEGRCLQQLSGVPLDEAFTRLFVKRTITSMQLVQSLARHAATPPKIIAHLWRQPLVKRQTHLKNMLLKHPNCPGDLKRSSTGR